MKWIKDPLVLFMIAGVVIFYVAGQFGEADIPYTIEVQDRDLQRLSDQWSMQMRRPPSETELSGLIEQFIKEEIYYREAQRLGLDSNDTIVRRRMVQKLTFLTEDIATAAPLDEQALKAFYAEHEDNYRLPQRFSFRHRYFSTDRRKDAQGDATVALGDNDNPGDPFMLQREYAQRSQREIGDLFGREFAQSLSALEPSADWQGPIKSAYGWHAVMVTDKQAATLQPFSAVKDKVVTDAQQASRSQANEDYYADLKARYEIRLPYASPSA